ncbi:MAG: endonuclease/exonuclease/phosphatase family protein [Campylobacterota bacterium]|nr:endonuclease/exonuclease/phosphatase family protein [Campylobacterota bacterium]
MLAPTAFPNNLEHQESSLDEIFSLVVWNIHKENQDEEFKFFLDKFLEEYPSDFLLLQEVKYPKNLIFSLDKYSYALSSNMETAENIFGVLSACKVSFEKIQNFLSSKKELGFTTHKSALLTKHILHNKQPLYILNIHAINFVSHDMFELELSKIKTKIKNYRGALIIAGDFNSWNNRRMRSLEILTKEFSLQKAKIKNDKHLLQIFSFTVDHIFYRGVELLEANSIDTKDLSDHNPIYAKFKV